MGMTRRILECFCASDIESRLRMCEQYRERLPAVAATKATAAVAAAAAAAASGYKQLRSRSQHDHVSSPATPTTTYHHLPPPTST